MPYLAWYLAVAAFLAAAFSSELIALRPHLRLVEDCRMRL